MNIFYYMYINKINLNLYMYVGKISAQSYKSFCREFSTRTLFIVVVFLTNILQVQWSIECSFVEIFPRCFLPIAQVDCRAIAM